MNRKTLISKNTSYFLRGIAILMVVCSHYFDAGADEAGNPAIFAFISALGDPAVGVFFFLSGYSLQIGYGDRRPGGRFLWRRFVNMYLPYLVIALLIKIYSGFEGPEDVWKLLTGYDHWFIITILVFYLSFFLVGQLPRFRVGIMTVFVILMSLYLFQIGKPEFWYDADWAFPVGMIIGWLDTGNNHGERLFSLNIKDWFFCSLGKASLCIYMVHLFVYYRVINFGPILDSGMSWYIKCAISLAISILLALILDKLFGLLRMERRKNEKKS